MVTEQPLTVEECSVGTGAACASVYLDQAFIALFEKKLGKKAKTILRKRGVDELVRHFDQNIKRIYDPYDDWCDEEFDVGLGGLRMIKLLGLKMVI